MHGIVAYTFLDVCEKFTSSYPVLKKMHTEENRSLFSASPCVECVALTEAMLLSGPPSVGDDSGQSRYQSLSSVQTVTGAQGRSQVLPAEAEPRSSVSVQTVTGAQGRSQVLPAEAEPRSSVSVQTVTGAQERSHVLTGLLPGRLYAVAVAPYAESVDGAASNTVYLQTADDGTILYDTIRYEKLSQLEVCMGMGKTGIPWVPWDSHGNGSKISDGMGMGWERELSAWEWELRRGNWQKTLRTVGYTVTSKHLQQCLC